MVGQIPTEIDGQYLLHPLWFVFLVMGDTGRHKIASESNVIILVSGFEQFSIECRKQPGFYWLCCTTPCDWSNETRTNLSTNQMQNLHPNATRHSRFPALLRVFTLNSHWLLVVFFFTVIGRCDCFIECRATAKIDRTEHSRGFAIC